LEVSLHFLVITKQFFGETDLIQPRLLRGEMTKDFKVDLAAECLQNKSFKNEVL
jgi:hypothetical protein